MICDELKCDDFIICDELKCDDIIFKEKRSAVIF